MAKYPINRDPRRHPDFPNPADLSGPRYKNQFAYHWDAWNRARQRAGLPRVDPPTYLGIGVTFKPPINNRTGVRPSNASISYNEWRNRQRMQSGPLIDAFGRQREQGIARNDHLLNTVVASDLGDDERMEVEQIINQLENNGGSISSADFDDADGAGPSNQVEPTMSQKRPADTQAGGAATRSRTAASPAEAVATATSSGSGHNSGSDGGFDSAQGPVSFLPSGGYQVKPGHMTFKKVHRMKSWAIPYYRVGTNNRGGANMITTPLAKIPWEYMFFYMSPEEFALIPAGSYVSDCSIKVMQTVATTGYPTGGSTSSIATTNHPKVLVVGKDLEKSMRGGVDLKATIDATMKPTALGAPDYDDFIAKQYGTDQTATDANVVVPGCAHKIPYYNYNHFCIYQPNNAQATSKGFDANNAPGFEFFQNVITEINSNDTTWDYVDQMYYKFNSAPIGEQYTQLELATSDTTPFGQSVGSARNYNATRNTSLTNPGSNITISETISSTNRNSLPIVTYKSSTIEKGSHFVRGDNNHKPSRQPTYHIGMRAIDKLSPEANTTRASDFVQANIEFEIEATINIRLPSYPNRFLKPKYYNTSIENAVMGNGTYPDDGPDRIVTWSLYVDKGTAPAVHPVDQMDEDQPTEGNLTYGSGRPRRSLRRLTKLIKKKK